MRASGTLTEVPPTPPFSKQQCVMNTKRSGYIFYGRCVCEGCAYICLAAFSFILVLLKTREYLLCCIFWFIFSTNLINVYYIGLYIQR